MFRPPKTAKLGTNKSANISFLSPIVSKPSNQPTLNESINESLDTSYSFSSSNLNTSSTGLKRSISQISLNKPILHQTGSQHLELVTNFPPFAIRSLDDAPDLSEVDGKIDSNGTCGILVKKSKLIVWNIYQKEGNVKGDYELPISKYNFTSTLFETWKSDKENGTIHLLVCSKDGFIRYWNNISVPSSFVDSVIPLNGDYITHISINNKEGETDGRKTLIACSSSGNINEIIVSSSSDMEDDSFISSNGVRNTTANINTRLIQSSSSSSTTSTSMFGLVGKLFGFGTQASKQQINTGDGFFKSIYIQQLTDGSKDIYLLSSSSLLQKWNISSVKDRNMYEYSLSDQIKSKLSLSSSQSIFPIALQPYRRYIYVLIGVQSVVFDVNNRTVNILGFYLVELSISPMEDGSSSSNVPPSLSEIVSLRYEPRYDVDTASDLLSARLLISEEETGNAFIYWPKHVITARLPVDQVDIQMINFMGVNDHIIGGGNISNQQRKEDSFPAFLFGKYGIASIKYSTTLEEKIKRSASAMETTLDVSFNFESLEKLEARRDQLGLAFKKYLAGDRTLLTRVGENFLTMDDLEETITSVSETILDSFPVNDPRWAEDDSSNSKTSSLLLTHQLNEKKQKHESFLQFIQSDSVFFKRISPSGQLILKNHAEKLNAAIALRNFQNIYDQSKTSRILLKGIEMCSQNRLKDTKKEEFSMIANISVQDIFYCQVSRIEEILMYLQDILSHSLHADKRGASQETEMLELDVVNQIFLIILGSYSVENLSESTNLLKQLDSQLSLSFKYFSQAKNGLNKEGYVTVLNKLFVMCDLLLASLLFSSTSSNSNQSNQISFQNTRSNNIQVFIDESTQEATSFARQLAEKYLDFLALITICKKLKDDQRLHSYIYKFDKENFGEFLFKYYLDKGELKTLLTLPNEFNERVSLFLQTHTSISWINDLKMKNYAHASESLLDLGINEVDILPRKKTLLSLSKLTSLAAGAKIGDISAWGQLFKPPTATPVDILNKSYQLLHVIKAQEIYSRLLEGVDVPTKPATVEEVIRVLISARSSDAKRLRAALDLYANAQNIINDKERSLLKQIWFATFAFSPFDVLAADWEKRGKLLSDTDIIEGIKQTIFFESAVDRRTSYLLDQKLLREVMILYQQSRGQSFDGKSESDPVSASSLQRLCSTVESLILSEREK